MSYRLNQFQCVSIEALQLVITLLHTATITGKALNQDSADAELLNTRGSRVRLGTLAQLQIWMMCTLRDYHANINHSLNTSLGLRQSLTH